jgi:hypothetical protein
MLGQAIGVTGCPWLGPIGRGPDQIMRALAADARNVNAATVHTAAIGLAVLIESIFPAVQPGRVRPGGEVRAD